MVSENLDLVRSIYADWEGGDFSAAVWAGDNVELVVIGGAYPGRFVGKGEMAGGFRGFASAWEGFSTHAQEYRELADSRVLVLTHDSGHGKASGLDIGAMAGERALLFEIDDGQVSRLTIYRDRDRAVADLGLEE